MANNIRSEWQRINPARKKVIIWGAGDQFRVNQPILFAQGIDILAFVDETPGVLTPIPEIPLFQTFAKLYEFLKSKETSELGSVVCIGNPFSEKRLKYLDLLSKHGIDPISFADETSLIRDSVRFSYGLQVMPTAVIHNNVIIGSSCIVNTGALVEHDCILGNGVEIGPRAVLTGRVTVEDHAWIGAGAVILPRLSIGAGAIVGAGAVVTKNVPPYSIVAGSPARKINEIRNRPA